MLIDRDNLLARIDRCVRKAGKDAAQVMAIRDIKALISVMPEVHREVKVTPVVHGEWIGELGEHVPLTDGRTDSSCSCSICGSWLVGSDEYATYGYYCPNCGAKMDLEGHDGNQ